jgi:hypothetical protein
MTEPIENNEKNCCNYIDDLDDFLDSYQKHSGKISIVLSIMGGISAILAGKLIIAGSIAVGITNASLFFSGLMIEKIVNKKHIIESENKSLKNEIIKRQTLINNYQFPVQTPTPTDYNISPSSKASTQYEKVLTIEFKN